MTKLGVLQEDRNLFAVANPFHTCLFRTQYTASTSSYEQRLQEVVQHEAGE